MFAFCCCCRLFHSFLHEIVLPWMWLRSFCLRFNELKKPLSIPFLVVWVQQNWSKRTFKTTTVAIGFGDNNSISLHTHVFFFILNLQFAKLTTFNELENSFLIEENKNDREWQLNLNMTKVHTGIALAVKLRKYYTLKKIWKLIFAQ